MHMGDTPLVDINILFMLFYLKKMMLSLVVG